MLALRCCAKFGSSGADPARALEIARANLKRCYTVGTLEKLNATIGVLSNTFPQYFDPDLPEPPRVRQTSGLKVPYSILDTSLLGLMVGGGDRLGCARARRIRWGWLRSSDGSGGVT